VNQTRDTEPPLPALSSTSLWRRGSKKRRRKEAVLDTIVVLCGAEALDRVGWFVVLFAGEGIGFGRGGVDGRFFPLGK
jgi:hypothetical protein